MNVGVQIGVGN